ncbi:hypothetical protein SD81_032645 [Tolypothrix campylonemoides VB511288]|nr:hypothetical protein SD81_032645 [Tolypothrix campylonemoides VB511288]
MAEHLRMRQDFSNQNLRGRSFKGENLTGANFSYADIRGADFTNAQLKGANFTGVTAGLQRRWTMALLIVAWLLSALLGFIATLTGLYITSFLIPPGNNQILIFIPGLAILVTLIIFLAISIRQNLRTNSTNIFQAWEGAVSLGFSMFGALSAAISLILILVTAITQSQFGNSYGSPGIVMATTVVAALIAASAVGFILAVAGVICISGFVSAIIVVLASIVGCVIATQVATKIGVINRTGLEAIAILINLVASLMGINGGRQTIVGNDTWMATRSVVITVAVTFATKFCYADLTGANFTQATLKNTNFRKAILIRTYWLKAQKLHLSAVGNTYLKDALVRKMVITGKGQGKNFDNLNLRGVNLHEANLVDASFIGADLSEANLRNADLSGAKLVQTQLDRTDFTGATLTGATIEDWGITGETKLDGVKCDYVFMRVETKDDPNRRRKPDDWDKTFEEGEFAEFIAPIVKTLDLYHNKPVNLRAARLALNQLIDNNPEAEILPVAVEMRGTNNDKVLIKNKTAEDANHSELNAKYFEEYNKYKLLPPEVLIGLVTEKEKTILMLTGQVDTAMRTAIEKPSINAETYQNQGDTMSEKSETSKYNFSNPKFGGGFSGDGGTTIGGTLNDYSSNIDYSSKQNLVEAAAEIQQLLTQLQNQGYSQEQAQQQAAQDLAKKAENDPTVLGKLVKWGQSLGDTATKTTVSEAAKEVFKLALRLSGIPIP